MDRRCPDMAFLLSDGVTGYRVIAQGRLEDLRVLNRVDVGLTVIAAAAVVAVLSFWRQGGTQLGLFPRDRGAP